MHIQHIQPLDSNERMMSLKNRKKNQMRKQHPQAVVPEAI